MTKVRIPFFGEMEEYELGMLHPEEPRFAKIVFPVNLKSALSYRHLIASVFLMHRGFPCFKDERDDKTFVIARNRSWTLIYIVPEQFWKFYDARRKQVIDYKTIDEVLTHLKEKL